ncbi:MAG TPA: hypothetical protein VJ673_11470 [Aromatoleum sp.]|uniref:hypothetical protein n=1 Tax=Aromatoleum sp. TaxID=2307007 RepID=UPI002B45E70B|nr:hypothetical protein [Aromatoleum sp.]HJV26301.1 hypothetical protein [Aromatoleum sp.]
MSNLFPHPQNEDRERQARFLREAALVVAIRKDLDTAAARSGVSADQLIDFAASDSGSRAIAAEIDRLRDSGELLKAQALAPLEKLVGKMNEMVEAGEVSPSAAPKLADVLFKLTGTAEERAARLRAQAEEDEPKVTVHILHPGDADPPPAKAGQHRLVIDLRGKARQKVLDVTPTGKGADDDE